MKPRIGKERKRPSARREFRSALAGAALMTLLIFLLLPLADQRSSRPPTRIVKLRPVELLLPPRRSPPPRPAEPSRDRRRPPPAVAPPRPPIATPIPSPEARHPAPSLPMPDRPPHPGLPAFIPSPPPRETILTAGSADAPRRLRGAPPDYPPTARYNGIEGEVEAVFTIGPQGHVLDIAIVHARPPGVFEKTVTEALRSWRFAPSSGERPDPMRLRQVFRFQMR